MVVIFTEADIIVLWRYFVSFIYQFNDCSYFANLFVTPSFLPNYDEYDGQHDAGYFTRNQI